MFLCNRRGPVYVLSSAYFRLSWTFLSHPSTELLFLVPPPPRRPKIKLAKLPGPSLAGVISHRVEDWLDWGWATVPPHWLLWPWVRSQGLE